MGLWKAWFRGKRVEEAMSEELRHHVESMIDEYMSNGMSEEDARKAALRDFGRMDGVKEACRDENRVSSIEALKQDVSLSFRMMRKTPAFTAAIVFTLALGCGAATAIFSVVNSVLLRPLAVREPERIVYIWENDRLRNTQRETASLPDFLDMRRETKSYEHLAAYMRQNVTMSVSGEPERILAARITPDYFHVLGLQPAVGHLFTESENKAANAALLGHGLWKRRFGMNPNVVGTSLTLDGQLYTIAGVMPPEASEALAPVQREEIWIPITYSRNEMFRGRHLAWVLGRLKTGVAVQQANEEIAVVMSALEKAYPDDNMGRGAYVTPAMEQITGQLQRPLYLLWGAVGLLLLIACANVANLLVARAFAREQEMSIRISLGAARSRLVRQLATENLVLAIAGGIGGLLLSHWGIQALVALAPPTLARIDQVQMDGRVFAFTLGAVTLSWLLFGVLPAWRTANPAAMRAGRGHSQRVRKVLISVEVALAVTLVASSGLLGRSFLKLLKVDLGMRTAGIYTVSIDLPAAMYQQPARWPITEWPQVEALHERMLEEARRQPGVQSAAISTASLARGAWTTRVTVDGRPTPAPGDQKEAELRIVTPDYFATLGIPLKRGRLFGQSDDKSHVLVAIINDAFIKEHFATDDPVGKRIRIFGRLHEIVGIAGDARYNGAGSEMAPAMYLAFRQFPLSALSLVVRASSDPQLAKVVRAADPNLAVYDATSMDRVFASTYELRRFTLVLAMSFAGIALCLAAAGVYALISFTVERQTREIGIRMALGAPRAGVFLTTVRSAIFRITAGLAAGLAATFAVARGIESMLYEVQPWDPATYASVSVLLLLVAIVAAWLPATRASRIDPMVALRYE